MIHLDVKRMISKRDWKEFGEAEKHGIKRVIQECERGAEFLAAASLSIDRILDIKIQHIEAILLADQVTDTTVSCVSRLRLAHCSALRSIYGLVVPQGAEVVVAVGGSYHQEHLHSNSDLDACILCGVDRFSHSAAERFRKLCGILGLGVNENYRIIAHQMSYFGEIERALRERKMHLKFSREQWTDETEAISKQILSELDLFTDTPAVMLQFYHEMMNGLSNGSPIDHPDFFKNEQFGALFMEYVCGSRDLFRSFETQFLAINAWLRDTKSWPVFCRAETRRYLKELEHWRDFSEDRLLYFMHDIYALLYLLAFRGEIPAPSVRFCSPLQEVVCTVNRLTRSAMVLEGEDAVCYFWTYERSRRWKAVRKRVVHKNRFELGSIFDSLGLPLLRRVVSDWPAESVR